MKSGGFDKDVQDSHDEIVQRAAREFAVATRLPNPAERYRTRMAFLVVSNILAPEVGSNTQTQVWRRYASAQFKEATGQQLPMQQLPVEVWRHLGRIGGFHFIPELRVEFGHPEELALAILNRDKRVRYDHEAF